VSFSANIYKYFYICYLKYINTDSTTEQIFTPQRIFEKSLLK